MKRLKMLLLAALLAFLLTALEVTWVAGGHHGYSMPGSLQNVSRNDKGLQHVVLAMAYSFNNQSNDAFLFKPSAIHKAQRQIVKGMRYIVDLDISRTVCQKRDHNKDLTNCDFQPEGHLQQTFRCHSNIWVIPWQNWITTLVFNCLN